MKDFVEKLEFLVKNPGSREERYKEARESILEHVKTLDFENYSSNDKEIASLKVFVSPNTWIILRYTLRKNDELVNIHFEAAKENYFLRIGKSTDALLVLKKAIIRQNVLRTTYPLNNKQSKKVNAYVINSFVNKITNAYSNKIEECVELIINKIDNNISKIKDIQPIESISQKGVVFELDRKTYKIKKQDTYFNKNGHIQIQSKSFESEIELVGNCKGNYQISNAYHKIMTKFNEKMIAESVMLSTSQERLKL